MNLRELQLAFVAALRDPARAAGLLGELDALGLARLAVHRRSMVGSHLDALVAHYPAVRALVGADYFEALARRHLDAEPARAPDLGRYGATFAAFLESFAPARELPYLPDLARLEWAWHRAGLAAPPAPPDLGALALCPEAEQPELRFALPAGACLLASPYPLRALFALRDAGEDAAPVELDGPEERLVVFRRGDERRIDPLDRDEHDFLSGCDAGSSLGELALRLAVDRLLPTALARGWLASCRRG